MTTEEIDYRAAATAARQLVKQYIALQGLDAILQDLAGKQSAKNGFEQRIARMQLEESEQAARLQTVKASADTAAARAEEAYAAAIAEWESKRAGLEKECNALDTRRIALAESVERLARENKEIRDRLAAAVA